MEKIVELFNKLDDLGKLVPELDKVMDWVLKFTTFAVRIGPACILFLGLIYLVIPPNEANHKAGYRTFFGMGSVGAWRFTQFVAGLIMTVTGLVLNGKAAATVKSFSLNDTDSMLDAAFSVIKTQVICVVAIFVFMSFITAIMFTVKGKLRFKAMRGTLFEKLLFDEKPLRLILQVFGVNSKKKASSKPQRRTPPAMGEAHITPEPEEQFERQGEQVITADDIIIEGL